ncbi:MAG: hypothetical protein J6Z38_00995 [Lachnospiraceae bacterium]|nr:hypothetical protein [Lachnospiraceae bacterium]
MTSLFLKLIAVVTMVIDHTAACLNLCGRLPYGDLYRALRAIGRLAFPLYGFMIAVGARYTKNKLKYALRMLVTLILAELPFDMALFGSWEAGGFFAYFANGHQNVYMTLLSGLLTVYVMQWAFSKTGVKRAGGIVLWLTSVALAAFLCERVLETDYGWAGIFMIAVFGVLALPLKDFRLMIANEHAVNMLVSAAAIFVLIFLTNDLEYWALVALLPIGLYNGRKGYSNRGIQYGFYAVYPLHLLVLTLLFVLPLLKLKAALLPPL